MLIRSKTAWRRDGFAAVVLALCAAASPTLSAPLSTYVVIGEDGAPSARALVETATCPSIRVDGRPRAMRVRAPAGTLPLRPTQSTAENSKPSAFPVTVCEAALPHGARRASVEGVKLPLPPAVVRRIVVIGDTGCRLKAAENAYQACNDPRRYPFAAVAKAAAAFNPDMVMHVGDYLYRENPCRAEGCEGSAWGYGWDAWDADFFTPAAPLLRAAAWAASRGNHENCDRGGQGWWRLLDAHALVPGRDCVDPKDDVRGDYSPAYAVPLGGGARAVVFDLAIAAEKGILPGSPEAAQFAETYADIDRLSRGARFVFAVDHKPVLGLSVGKKTGKLEGGTRDIQNAFRAQNPDIVPAGIDVLLAGHVHLWEQASFKGPQPSQFIAGFSGTLEDVVPLPKVLPADAAPAAGVAVEHFSSWVYGFGYMTLERRGPRAWTAEVHDVEGKVLNRCRIEGKHSRCDKAWLPERP